VFYGVFIAEEIDGVVDKGSGDTAIVNVQTLSLSLFEHMPEICLFY
jgi:hypothetical protein